MEGANIFVSFQTVAELRRWTLQHNWGPARIADLDAALADVTVMPSTDALARRWAEISVIRDRAGRRIECGDAWIAATAVLYGLPLLTNNAKHFADIPGLVVVSH